jgi:hypothetical protein
MDSEEEKPKAFKVDDRRRFSAEGELKPEFQGAEQTAPPQPQPSARPAPGPSASSAAVKAGTADQALSGEATEISFTTFMVGLSTQALFHLGEMADPQGGAPAVDLPAAQQLIDIIGMIKEKTRGNLDHDEQVLLDAILYELRMKYVERARQPAR